MESAKILDTVITTETTTDELPDLFNASAGAQTLEELREKASLAARELSAAHNGDSVDAIEKARNKAQFAVEEYNKLFLAELLASYLDKDCPVKEAVTECYYSVLRLSEKQTDLGVEVDLGLATKVVSLESLVKVAGKRLITSIGGWLHYVEKLGLVFAMRATVDIGGNIGDLERKYKMSEKARSLYAEDKTRKATAHSTTSLEKATQEAVDAILFIDNGKGQNTLHITSKDVYFMLYTMFRRGKKELAVAMPRTSTIVTILTEVMYKLINGKCYSAEYDSIESK